MHARQCHCRQHRLTHHHQNTNKAIAMTPSAPPRCPLGSRNLHMHAHAKCNLTVNSCSQASTAILLRPAPRSNCLIPRSHTCLPPAAAPAPHCCARAGSSNRAGTAVSLPPALPHSLCVDTRAHPQQLHQPLVALRPCRKRRPSWHSSVTTASTASITAH